ncbi:DUF1631 family protein [Chitinolyticbacter meiyuanensis]|uniref:DUF1631 family protein n=1 Tax=Chitinolyticbacter meiyuanensis TaxID=682798 RepID=UPI001651FC97|nr:DUF1631 family protein [Chitinolyticbacter meiyuanensis]
MDHNDLLAATRAEFLRLFNAALDDVIGQAGQQLFLKAERALSGKESNLLWDARSAVLGQGAVLRRQLQSEMSQLLNRSFKTAYSSERPSFANALSTVELSLVNQNAFEDELRIDAITKYLRNEADDQLRDLNIRIALLFGQEVVKERENPFRPYLLSRCVSNAVDALHLERDAAGMLVEQLCEGFAGKVCDIYEALNALLARHGLAAQLQIKIKPAPSLRRPAAPGGDPAAFPDTGFGPATEGLGGFGATGFGQTGMGQQVQAGMGEPGMAAPSREQRLLDMVHAFQAATSGAAPQPGWSAPTPAPAASIGRGGWLAGTQRAGTMLRNLFSGVLPWSGNGVGNGQVLTGGLSLNSLLAAQLAQLQSTLVATQAVLGDDGEPRNLLLEHRNTLVEESRDNREQMTIDIVAMLFEFILRDTNVPAEVRAQLGRLQFQVLKLALQDPTLLTERNHPARVLVNRIGSISLALKQIDPQGERVATEICRIVETLLAEEVESAALFSRMLDELDAFIARELRSSEAQVTPALEAVERAEVRTLQFARIVAMISEALVEIRLDDFLDQFLRNSWARVIEQASRGDTQQALRYWRVVPELVWSIAPKLNEEERLVLRTLLMGMVSTLRDGLAEASRQDDQGPLFHWLLDAHKLALRGSSSDVIIPPLVYFRERFEAFVENETFVPPEKYAQRNSRLDSQLLAEAIRELETRLDLVDQWFDDEVEEAAALETVEAEMDAEESDDFDETLARLRCGVGIEINLDGAPTQAILSWPDLAGGRLVLSFGEERPPSILTMRLFRRLLNTGRARFAEQQELFERAVEQLVDSADRLDAMPA